MIGNFGFAQIEFVPTILEKDLAYNVGEDL